ncbi:putative DUF4185 family protein [Corynebacterium epidermidicanis]|uniref:Putative DUF4185 family protein n=2 Tax=Corynebacterium epidermidicanis TaxID=1050174 RepID=A0A0G3GT68_9CORY|nr:putative DUF4185 family protein [Corynebacterium epidermidicanis]
MIGDLLGPGISDHLNVRSGDLGTMGPIGTGREFAIIFGDSFRGVHLGDGEWLSPVGAVAELDANGKIVLKRPLNNSSQMEQLIRYQHNDRGLTLLPSDVINGTLYLQAMWNEGVDTFFHTADPQPHMAMRMAVPESAPELEVTITELAEPTDQLAPVSVIPVE